MVSGQSVFYKPTIEKKKESCGQLRASELPFEEKELSSRERDEG